MTTVAFHHPEYALDQIGAAGYGRIPFKVRGYWSGDSITLYIKRSFIYTSNDATAGEWVFEVSQSSGGRDAKEVADDLEAAANFGQAMIAAAELGRKIQQRVDGLERAFQTALAARRAEDAARRQAEAAAAAADEAVGPIRAKAAIDAAIARTKGGDNVTINAIQRGTERATAHITFERKRGYLVRVMIDYRAASRAEAILRLANASARSLEQQQ